MKYKWGGGGGGGDVTPLRTVIFLNYFHVLSFSFYLYSFYGEQDLST